MVTLLLAWRGFRARPGVSVALLLVAAIAVATAVAGPVYLQSGGDSIARSTLSAAPSLGNEVSVVGAAFTTRTGAAQVTQLQRRVQEATPAQVRSLFTEPVPGLSAAVLLGEKRSTTLAWRGGQCEHLHLSAGGCPTQAGDVLVSTVFATDRGGWRVGQRVTLDGQPQTVRGLYQPVDPGAPYWGTYADSYFRSLSPPPGPNYIGPTDDAVFTVPATFRGGRALLDLPVRVSAVLRTDIPALTSAVSTLSTRLEGPDTNSGIVATSTIGSVLDTATAGYAALRLPVALVVAQLLLLCWLVLFFVVAATVDARAGEVALAKVRGLPPLRTLRFGLAEVGLAVLLAIPLGVGIGYGAIALLVARVLFPGTPTELGWLAWLAAAVAAAGGAVAALAASRATLTRSVLEQWRRAGRGSRTRSWVLDTVAAALAVAGLISLLRGGAGDGGEGTTQPDPVSLLAPGLLVVAVGLVGSRLVPALGLVGIWLTRRRGTAVYLAARQLARRPGGARLVLVLTSAFGLAAFAVSAEAVGTANAASVAGATVGAEQVLTVAPPPGQSLAGVVAQVDPTGRRATVVDSYYNLDQPHLLTLGVDPAGFAAIAAWPPGTSRSPTELDRLLNPSAPDPIVLNGTRLRVELTVLRLAVNAPVALQAQVRPARGGEPAPVPLGKLPSRGPATLTGPLPACGAGGCVLRALQLVPAQTAAVPVAGTLQFRALASASETGRFHPVPSGFSAAGHWQSADQGRYTPPDVLSADDGGLTYTLNAPSTTTPGIDAVDTPIPVPALVSADVAARADGPPVKVTGLDGGTFTVEPVGVAPVLPGYLGPVVVVDRTYGLRAGNGLAGTADQQVWVAPGAGPAVTAGLRAAGAIVVDTVTTAQAVDALYAQGPLLALALFVAGAAAAALLTVGGVVVNLWLTGRRRGYEIAALTVVGLRRRTLYTALLLEQGALVVGGAILGIAAGIAAALLVLPAVPEFTSTPAAALLHYTPPTYRLAVLAAATSVLLLLCVAAVSRGVLRAARPALLREAQA